jgi:hypothetical protein
LSEIVEVITGMIQIIADNPASILIVLGFLAVLIAVFVPLEVGMSILLGALGLSMIGIGIFVHAMWLEG